MARVPDQRRDVRGEQRHAVVQPEDEGRRCGGRPRWCRARRPSTTAMENAPRSRRSMARVASASEAPPAICCSIRWASTSVSVAEVMVCPAASSSARSSAWFSMIPLWIRARRPVQSVCGWAFSAVGLPWVAQRVWPMAAACPVGRVGRQLAPAWPPSPCRPAGPAPARRSAVDHHGDAGRVVAPVLELVERAEEQGDGVGLAGDADDAAHGAPGYLGLPGACGSTLPQGRLDDRRRAGPRPRRPGLPPAPRP